MKFTVDTHAKRITLIGSFKFEDLKNLQDTLPTDWQSFSIEMEPVKEYVYYPYSTGTFNTPGTWSGTINCGMRPTITQTDLNFGPDSKLN